MTEKEMYANPYGIWHVTTEGLSEKSYVRYLGTYEGYIDDIAFALSSLAELSLTFTKVMPVAILDPFSYKERNEVNLKLSSESGNWISNKEEIKEQFKFLLRGRDDKYDIIVDNGGCLIPPFCVKLVKRPISKREIALSKLTQEEKEILGLEVG